MHSRLAGPDLLAREDAAVARSLERFAMLADPGSSARRALPPPVPNPRSST
jgi:hypothetical protein